jgi:hypothetical protein
MEIDRTIGLADWPQSYVRAANAPTQLTADNKSFVPDV